MRRKSILHITNDYSGSKVYMNLIHELDELGVEQIVYHPIKDIKNTDKNKIDFKEKKSKIIYSKIINKTIDRILYRQKIHKILSDIEKKVDFSEISLIHAHTWYSDGGVAYLLSKKYNVPYIVAVRNSDLNVFYKYLFYERCFGKKILEESNKVITISQVYKDRLLKQQSLSDLIHGKVELIPNGVDPFWVSNITPKKDKIEPKLIYVGKFNKGKNVINLILAVLFLKDKYPDIKLQLIGGGGSEQEKIKKLIKIHSDTLSYKDKISNKEVLCKYYQSNYIFAMPSKHETFGLVYIEALLQGLPVLYTQQEGIDGSYDNSIGEKIENFSKYEIADKIEKIIDNYDQYDFNQQYIANNHNWKNIAKQTELLYSKCGVLK